MRLSKPARTWVVRTAGVCALFCGGFILASPIGMAPPGGIGEWEPVRDRSLEIVAGSPLDFSSLAGDLVGDTPLSIAGERLVLGGSAPRINCAMLAPGFSETANSGFPDHPTADRYAEQLRRHGYNLARFHYLDSLLMTGARQDFAFDPVQLDRLQYLMGALKRNGIRWMLDMMSSDNAALGGVFPNRWSQRRGMLIRIFIDPAAFDHWRALAIKLLTTRNPYTGLTLAADPATAALVLVNEDDINMQSVITDNKVGGRTGHFPDMLRAPYAVWLRAQGSNPAEADQLPRFGASGPALQRFQQFLTARQIATSQAMRAAVRAAGYDGPTTGFANWSQTNMVPSRRGLPFVDNHGYDQVPPGGVPGAQVKSISSLDNAARYLNEMAGTRFFGRPFTVTEHDQTFWNPYRYESGLVAPAIASLQGWQFICRHADGPIDLAYDGIGNRKDALGPDGGGLDPVARAGETLTALLLLRREIAPARPTIGIPLDDAQALAGGGWRAIPLGITAAAWVARVGLVDDRSRQIPDLTVLVDSPSGPAARVAGALKPMFERTVPIIEALKARGLIPPDNATDPTRNRWESANGQVWLLGDRRQMFVTTAETSAIVFGRIDEPVDLGPLRVEQSDAPALFALSALDGKSLRESGRILVILASDARNTGMKTASDGTLITLGKLPIEMRRVRLDATLAAPAGSRWTLTPLRLNGAADKSVPLVAQDKGLSLPLDTSLSPNGPTTYFLLRRDT